ncbi:MAG: type II toxin-antitoxin system Phd/YefM family antitoxin [Nitrospinae bacterium]|nr:type II toxin-antitoxin system Phd/YefM family antitoxin [Nitrospinota bacterium]
MAIVTIHQAKTHFSQLIQRALAGEEIIVSRGKEPVARIVPIPEARKERRLGGAKGIVKYIAKNFDEPLEEFEDFMR